MAYDTAIGQPKQALENKKSGAAVVPFSWTNCAASFALLARFLAVASTQTSRPAKPVMQSDKAHLQER
jgi:hypothetical protein